jgi:hypothetical protein
MALIDSDNPVTAEDQYKFWEDTLKNTRALLFNLDKAIYALTSEERKSYSMDTGQTTINVTLQDVPGLIDRRDKLIKQIEQLEEKLGIDQSNQTTMTQAVPAW